MLYPTMGYDYGITGGSFTIKNGKKDEALALLCENMLTFVSNETLQEFFDDVAIHLIENEQEDIIGLQFQTLDEDAAYDGGVLEALLSLLAPVVESGSWLSFCNDEGVQWMLCFSEGEMIEEHAKGGMDGE